MSRRTELKIIAVAIGLVCSTVASAAETVAYTYDARGRLTKVVRPNASGQQVQTCYKYDKADNRANVTTTVTASGGTLPDCPL